MTTTQTPEQIAFDKLHDEAFDAYLEERHTEPVNIPTVIGGVDPEKEAIDEDALNEANHEMYLDSFPSSNSCL